MDRNEELRIYMKAARAKVTVSGDRHLTEDEMIAFYRGRPMVTVRDKLSEFMETEIGTAQKTVTEEFGEPEPIELGDALKPEAQRVAARRHILQCDQCLQLFEDVKDFFEPRREDEVEVGELNVRLAWKTMAGTIKQSRGGFSRVNWPMAAAASLLLMLGLAMVFMWREREGKEHAQRQIAQMQIEQSKLEARLSQIERNAGDQLRLERQQRAQAEERAEALQNRLSDLQQALQNIPIYSRVLSSEKGGGDDWQLRIPATAKTFWLSLIRGKPYEFSEYSIELFDQQGKRIAERQGLRPIDSGYLSFALSGSELSTGNYSLLLYGHRGKSKLNLGKYQLSLIFSR